MTKGKVKNNSSFVLTICLMITLIGFLLVPTAMAWFTDKDIGHNSTTISFGTVDVGIKEGTTIFTASRSIDNLLPGDTINLTSVLSNEKSSVSAYAGVASFLKIKYQPINDEEQDITSHFQPYLTIDPISVATSEIIPGSDNIVLLEAGETLGLAGSVYFDTSLPNAIPTLRS